MSEHSFRQPGNVTLHTALAKLEGLPLALGIAIESCNGSQVEGTMMAGPEHGTAAGMRVHGGALMAFADTLGAIGTAAQLSSAQWTTTVDSSTHFIAAASPGLMRGTAHAIHRGRTTQVWRTDVFDSAQKLVAVVIQTQLVLHRSESVDVSNTLAVEACASEASPPAQSVSGGAQTIPEQRLRQIFVAASEVFGKKGYAGASMRDIAEAAGMPIPTMYQYVSGKEKLLLLVFETYMAEISSALTIANDFTKTPRQRLHDCVSVTLRLYDAYRRQIRLMYQETRSFSAENRERVRKLTRSTHHVWEGIIRAGVASGDFHCRDTSVAASFIPNLCSIWVLHYSSMKETSLDDLRRSVLELLEGGLGVPAAHTTALAVPQRKQRTRAAVNTGVKGAVARPRASSAKSQGGRT